MTRYVKRALRGIAAGIWCAASTSTLAQIEPRLPSAPEHHQPAGTPDLAEPVLRLLEAGYLTDEERKDLRVFHGVWKEGDLDTPQRRAAAALIRGAFDDPSLSDASVSKLDRAEALLRRGEFEDAVQLLVGDDSLRAVRIRAESLEGLGKLDAAATAIEPKIAAIMAIRRIKP